MADSREIWARQIIRKVDPACRPRWEVFDDLIKAQADKTHICLNLGSGTAEPFDQPQHFRLAFDIDISAPDTGIIRTVPFLQADLYNLPLKEGSVDLVLLRFVVEHITLPIAAFSEIFRILKSGGKVLIITTNLISPFICLPKILLPYRWRNILIRKLYKVSADDVFPTHHRLNTRKAYNRFKEQFNIIKWDYLQDINWTRRWLFLLLFAFHLKTK